MTPEEWIAAHPEAIERVALLVGEALTGWTGDCNRVAHRDGDGHMGLAYNAATAAITSLLASGALVPAEAVAVEHSNDRVAVSNASVQVAEVVTSEMVERAVAAYYGDFPRQSALGRAAINDSEAIRAALEAALATPPPPAPALDRDAVERVDRDSWPEAVSDGLALACSDCGKTPRFDYRVTDAFWAESGAGPNVLCLPCLDARSGGVGLAAALIEVQWIGTGHTVCVTPRARYEYAAPPPPAVVTVADGREEEITRLREIIDHLHHDAVVEHACAIYELPPGECYAAEACAHCGVRRDEHAESAVQSAFPALDITDHAFDSPAVVTVDSEALAAMADDERAGRLVASGCADRFRDVLAEVLDLDENPGDDELVRLVRERHGKTGDEPRRWRDFTTSALAVIDQIEATEPAPDSGGGAQ